MHRIRHQWLRLSLLAWCCLGYVGFAAEVANTNDVKALLGTVATLKRTGRYAEALELTGKALNLAELGPNTNLLQMAEALGHRGWLFLALGDFPNAVTNLTRSLRTFEATLGTNAAQTADTRLSLAITFQRQGLHATARPLLLECLTSFEKAYGGEDAGTAHALATLAENAEATADYAAAVTHLLQSVKILEKLYGSDHGDTAVAVHSLACLYWRLGDLPKARLLLLKSVKSAGKALGEEHPSTAVIQASLATLYQQTGELDKALELGLRQCGILEKTLGPSHHYLADALLQVGQLYGELGRYPEGERALTRSLGIYEVAFGTTHQKVMFAYRAQGDFFLRSGDYKLAKTAYQKAFASSEAMLPTSPAAAWSITASLAGILAVTGDWSSAEVRYEQSLAMAKQSLGTNQLPTLTVRDNFADFCRTLGNLPKAEQLLQDNLQIISATGSDRLDASAATLLKLGLVYADSGDFHKAEKTLSESVRCQEQLYGEHHPDSIVANILLGEVLGRMGNYAKSEPLLKQCLERAEKTFGPEHIHTGRAANNLAIAHQVRGDNHNARRFLQRALQINQKTLGTESPATAFILRNLAYLELDCGDSLGALARAKQWANLYEAGLVAQLGFTAEAERLSFQSRALPYDLLATLGRGPELAQSLLRLKGTVLDSLIEDQRSARESGVQNGTAIVSELQSARRHLNQLQTEARHQTNSPQAEWQATKVKVARDRVERAEKELARDRSRANPVSAALSTQVEEVQSALGQGRVLAEFVRYNHYLGSGKWESRYGAVLIASPLTAFHKASKGSVAWVPLTSALSIDAKIQTYARLMRAGPKEDEKILRELYAEVFQPIMDRLPADTHTIVVSPDGLLSFLNLGTLTDSDGVFLAERFSIRHVSTGRDLISAPGPITTNRNLIALANPAFSVTALPPKPQRPSLPSITASLHRGFEALSLSSLPGTEAEAEFLLAGGKRWALQVKTFSGNHATESVLNLTHSPLILHLATHGFCLPDLGPSKPVENLQSQFRSPVLNPMLQSGLALAGAQTTLEAWKRGEVPPTENDGVFTAQEVATLDLLGTWLVVLSACDTGMGEAQDGEGVLGLRRGFVQAGAQNLLMTLWPISDKWSVDIMKAFYEKAMVSGDAPQAMADVQAEWLARLRKEKGVLIAARIAGPFVLSTRGRQSTK